MWSWELIRNADPQAALDLRIRTWGVTARRLSLLHPNVRAVGSDLSLSGGDAARFTICKANYLITFP